MTSILLDVNPARVRNDNYLPNGSVDQARVIYTGTDLYIATTSDRGRTVEHVYKIAVPYDEKLDYYGRYTRINGFSWSSCGCSSNWHYHTAEELIEMGDAAARLAVAEQIEIEAENGVEISGADKVEADENAEQPV